MYRNTTKKSLKILNTKGLNEVRIKFEFYKRSSNKIRILQTKFEFGKKTNLTSLVRDKFILGLVFLGFFTWFLRVFFIPCFDVDAVIVTCVLWDWHDWLTRSSCLSSVPFSFCFLLHRYILTMLLVAWNSKMSTLFRCTAKYSVTFCGVPYLLCVYKVLQ